MQFDWQHYQDLMSAIPSQELNIPLHVFEVIPSTNQKLWQMIEQGEPLPIAAIALAQTAGRGQWGKQWQSAPGGLYLSAGLETQIPVANAAHLTICSAWGIATALRECQIPVSLKWPNDLILEGRKLGGIKTETRLQQEQIRQAVIGVGINWSNPVPDGGINLAQTTITLEKLTATTLQGLLAGYQHYLSVGVEPLLSSYLTLLSSRGRKVSINGCSGEVVGVNSQGELRVRLHSQGAAAEVCLQPGSISLGYD